MKKTMKKVITISLVGLALALTGCGTDKPAAAKQEKGSGKMLLRRPALNHQSWKSELPIRQMKKRPPIRVF